MPVDRPDPSIPLPRGWPDHVCSAMRLPVSLAYALPGRFYLAKMMFASSACNGCGLCAANCPFGASRVWTGLYSTPPMSGRFSGRSEWLPHGAPNRGHRDGPYRRNPLTSAYRS
ncbi:4Fe-4S binding protein [bacterium]|nr:4Fe-4S binding protein [bacterium]